MKQNSKFLFVFLVLSLFISCAQAPQHLVSEKPVAPVVDLASEKIRDSIVWIESENASGTGFFVAPDKIATNTHVVAHIGSVSVKSPDRKKDWTIEGVIGFDAENSLVILKLTDKGKPLPLADRAQIGESVSISSYSDSTFKVSESRIQSIVKNDRWFRLNTTPAKKTNGSPVFNNNGQVIGVIVPYGDYAVSSSVLAALLDASMLIEPLTAWQQRKQVRAAAYYGLGKEKLDAEDYTGAIIDFDKVIESNPEYVRAYYERGRAQAYLGDYDSAIAACTHVLEMDPNAADAYYLRGSIKGRRGDYAKAIADLDKAIELDAQYAEAYSNRGGIKFLLGESEEAHGNAEKAQSLYEAAIADCNKAIQIDPEDANTYNFRGGAKTYLDDFEGAILDFNRAIQIDAADAIIYNNRGGAKFKLGESEAARENTKEAQRLYESSIADYTQSIEIDAEDANTYNNRGLAKTALGELGSAHDNPKKTEGLYESAIEDYTQAINLNPEHAEAHSNLGTIKSALSNMQGQ
ncbi:MAG: tetratricopeptide repeat protein [Candidatus Poribacteria bacterium]|nr:tetratricopeptide repeat protein [Candidatus Poribacteria bacterium]